MMRESKQTIVAVAVLTLVGLTPFCGGCTAADQQKVHGAYVDVMSILKWGCRAVSVAESIAPVSETSGGEDEEPHTIDEVE